MRIPKTIVPGLLYMSRHPAKWAGAGKLAWLRENVRHVLVLARMDDPELRELEEDGGPQYWHVATSDGAKRLDSRLYSLAKDVARRMRAGEPVLVACLVGRNRSGATCTLAVREFYNVTGSAALDYVRSRRPGAVKRRGPEDELRSLSKPRPRRPRMVLPQADGVW